MNLNFIKYKCKQYITSDMNNQQGFSKINTLYHFFNFFNLFFNIFIYNNS